MTEGHRPVAALPLDAKGLNMVTPLMQTQEAASSARPALGWTFKAGRDWSAPWRRWPAGWRPGWPGAAAPGSEI